MWLLAARRTQREKPWHRTSSVPREACVSEIYGIAKVVVDMQRPNFFLAASRHVMSLDLRQAFQNRTSTIKQTLSQSLYIQNQEIITFVPLGPVCDNHLWWRAFVCYCVGENEKEEQWYTCNKGMRRKRNVGNVDVLRP